MEILRNNEGEMFARVGQNNDRVIKVGQYNLFPSSVRRQKKNKKNKKNHNFATTKNNNHQGRTGHISEYGRGYVQALLDLVNRGKIDPDTITLGDILNAVKR